MRQSDSEIRNELQQYKDDFLMYGKYSAESLNGVIKTVNALHQHAVGKTCVGLPIWQGF